MRCSWSVTNLIRALLAGVIASGTVSCGTGPEDSGASKGHLEIQLIPLRAEYPVGDTLSARAVRIASNGTILPAGGAILRLLESSIASIAPNGRLHLVAPGTLTLEVTSGSEHAQLQLTVRGVLHTDGIGTNELWRAVDSPHVVEGEIAVGGIDGATLTIEPGSTVRFRPRAHMTFGDIMRGRLVIPAGGAVVHMQGDSAGRGTWAGIHLIGPGTTELRNVIFEHCGGEQYVGAIAEGCIVSSENGGLEAPVLLLDGVTFIEPHVRAMAIGAFSEFAPGSRNVSVHGSDDAIALVNPQPAGDFPQGGTFTGNARNEIELATGFIDRDVSWPRLGVTWRITGGVGVAGPSMPTLSILGGQTILVARNGGIGVGSNGQGRLIIGEIGGSPVSLEAAEGEWAGIDLEEGAGPSAFRHVTLRDCGARPEGACVRVLNSSGLAGPLVDDVTITGSRSRGFLVAGARFAAGSNNLTITNSVGAPIGMHPNGIASIPPGNYRGNGDDVIELMFGDNVIADAVWHDRGVPYRAEQGLQIGEFTNRPLLTLDPGVEIQVGHDQVVLAGDGALRAVGTAAKPILFTAIEPGTPGSWTGVIVSADARTKFDHIEIRDAGGGDPVWGGGLRIGADLGGVIRNSTIRRSSTCGIILGPAQTWTDDYTAPAFGNSFIDVAGPARCQFP